MKVYYDSSLWAKPRGKSGKIQKLDWTFEYLGQKCIIPCIYRFSKGIVFDIITLVEEEAFKAFHNKYENINQDKISNRQRRCTEQEHPYQSLSVGEVWVNGERVRKGYCSSSEFYTPLQGRKDEYKILQRAYDKQLRGCSYFGCQRFCIPYPKEAVRFQKFKRPKRGERVDSLRIVTHEQFTFYPLNKEFKLSASEPSYTTDMMHPVTGESYKLYFTREEESEIPFQEQKLYVTSASLKTVPELKEDEHLAFKNSLTFYNKPRSAYEPESVGSIGIIGGASGITCLNTTKGKSEERHCLSTITLEKVDDALFVLKGIDVKTHSRQIYEYEKTEAKRV